MPVIDIGWQAHAVNRCHLALIKAAPGCCLRFGGNEENPAGFVIDDAGRHPFGPAKSRVVHQIGIVGPSKNGRVMVLLPVDDGGHDQITAGCPPDRDQPKAIFFGQIGESGKLVKPLVGEGISLSGHSGPCWLVRWKARTDLSANVSRTGTTAPGAPA